MKEKMDPSHDASSGRPDLFFLSEYSCISISVGDCHDYCITAIFVLLHRVVMPSHLSEVSARPCNGIYLAELLTI